MIFKFKRPEESPGFLLWQLTNEWQRKQRLALKKIGLTHAQFVVLANILWLSSQENNMTTQQQIAELAKIDKMMISDLVKTLIQKKLLKRIEHKEDKRAYELILTTKGRELVLKAVPIVEEIDMAFFTEETKNLIHLLKALNHLIVKNQEIK